GRERRHAVQLVGHFGDWANSATDLMAQLTERSLDPSRRQLGHAASATLSSSSRGVSSSPNSSTALPIPPCSTNGTYWKSSVEIARAAATWSRICSSHA